MKRQFAALLLIGALTAPLALRAAEDAPKRPTVDATVQRLTQKLNLTSEQQPKVRAIIEARRKKEDSLREEARSVSDKSNKDIMALLTPEQQKTFNGMVNKRRSTTRPNAAKPAK
jgi:Spy/CpxP family protein refolding chaperone